MDLKQSFEQRLKRQGIAVDSTVKTREEYFNRFKGLPFWIEDKETHESRFDSWLGKTYTNPSGAKACCFNHAIGLPQKNGQPMPMFDYEIEIQRAIFEHRYVFIKKSVGLGISTLLLRMMAWLCLKDDEFAGTDMCIICGPRIETAVMLMNRLKGLFPDYNFQDKETVLNLGGVHLECYPSHHVHSALGLERPSFFFIDEADAFPIFQQKTVLEIAERYISKSDPFITLCSVPYAPGGLFQSIEQAEHSMYHRLIYDYRIGLGKIYTEAEVAAARLSDSFPREMEGQYIGLTGNVFSPESLRRSTEAGARLYAARKSGIPWNTRKSMGIDAGFGSSKFGICVTHVNELEGIIEVLYASEFERANFVEMINEILSIKRNYHVDKLYVDNSNPEILDALKRALNEPLDYHRELANIKSKNLGDPALWMNVLPVSFAAEHKQMLSHTKLLLDRGSLAIAPVFDKLLVALRTAFATESDLSKDRTSHNDLLDALRLSLKRYTIPTTSHNADSIASASAAE